MALPKLLAVAWLVNLVVALPVLPVVVLVEQRTAGMAPWPRNAVLTGAVLLATLLGVGLRVILGWLAPWAGSFTKAGPEEIVGYWMERALLCFGLAAIYVLHARSRRLADAAHAGEVAQQRLARQGTEATLQALQAQIEPISCSTRWQTYGGCCSRSPMPAARCCITCSSTCARRGRT